MSSPRVETVDAVEESKLETVEKRVENEKSEESCSKSEGSLPSSSDDAPKNDRDASAESPISRKKKHPQDSETTKVPKSCEGQDALVRKHCVLLLTIFLKFVDYLLDLFQV